MEPPVTQRQGCRPWLTGAATLIAALTIAACGSDDPDEPPPPNPRTAFEPAPGRYSYATRGFETVDALLGSRHSYPPRTRTTVAHKACGYTERWLPRRERRLQFDYCVTADGSRRLKAVDDIHEFFGYPEALHYVCKGEPVPALARVKIGFRWTDRCKARTTSLVLRGKVLRRSTLNIKGTEVPTVLLRVEARSRGKATGRNVNNSWLAVPSGLLVRRSVRGTATTRTPIGNVNSKERFRMELDAPPKPSSNADAQQG